VAVAMGQLIQKAREQLSDMTGLELGSTLSARKDDKTWHVQVEAVEKKSLPDSQDILATYDLTMDDDANVLDFNRIGMRKRGDTVIPGEESER
jgi:hypothetical protein